MTPFRKLSRRIIAIILTIATLTGFSLLTACSSKVAVTPFVDRQMTDIAFNFDDKAISKKFPPVPTDKEKMQHGVVHYEGGMYGGWPANGGVWSWGDEILVCYAVHNYDSNIKSQHKQSGPERLFFSRSLDGGVTWQSAEVKPFNDKTQPVPEGGFDFENPDFCMKVRGGNYIVSYDRGNTWIGKYALPKAEGGLSFRNCYFIEGNKKMKVFGSCDQEGVFTVDYTDRAYMIETTDGGVTWTRYANMTKDSIRSVMPAAVRLDDGTIAVALRRRADTLLVPKEEADAILADNKKPPHKQDCFIEVVHSKDEGRTWSKGVRAANTDDFVETAQNGNPPAMVKLNDGRLIIAYGYRGSQDGPAIRYVTSSDGGHTWSDYTNIRTDFIDSDLGYCRMVLRPDGKVVVLYYCATKDRPYQHIEYTILEV